MGQDYRVKSCNSLQHVADVFGSKFDRNFSPSAQLRPRSVRAASKAVLQKPIWFFLSPAISGRLGPAPIDFSMIFERGRFWPRRILRFPPSEPLRGSSSGDSFVDTLNVYFALCNNNHNFQNTISALSLITIVSSQSCLLVLGSR